MTRHSLVPLAPDRAQILRAAACADLVLREDAAGKLLVWLEKLVEWNQHMDLTAAKTTDELVDLMLIDAFVLAKHVARGATVVDVGAGAGAPGLALAIVRPDLRMTLVEPLAKRVAFLRTVTAAIGQENIGLLRMKCEELETRFDVSVARATFAPAEWLDRASDITVAGGSIWVLLAKDEPPVGHYSRKEEEIDYVWPSTGAARRAVRYVLQEDGGPAQT